ncbi:MAG TPA: ROK family protein [Phycisphaerae bacterium]
MPAKYAVGIDLGGTNIKVALVTTVGEIVSKLSAPTGAERGPDAVMDDMARLAQEAIAGARASPTDVVGAGIGSPGPLTHREGMIYKAANLPGFVNVRLAAGIAQRTGLRAVLDNDANAAAFGEFWNGAGRGCRDMVMLTLGTGVGSGVIVDGALVRGHFDNAGELGHMIVQPGGRLCGCGQHGCLEQYASSAGVGRRVADEVRAGASSSLEPMVRAGAVIGGSEVAAAAKSGDPLALRIWDEACYYLAIGCVNIQHAFNPAKVVLAGGMSKAGAFLVEAVKKHYMALRWKLLDDIPEIAIAELGNDAGVVGAAGIAWECERRGLWRNW